MSWTFADHFSSVSNAYRRYRPSYPPALYKFLAENAPGRSVVLDIGAGNGQAAAGMSHYFEHVYAIEKNQEMIDQALPTAGVHFHCAPAEDTGVKDACADVVMVAQALHWFDRPAFYKELDRILVPGGLFAVFTYGRPTIHPAIDALIAEYHEEIVAPFWPEEKHVVDAAYSSLELPFENVPVPHFRMRTKWTLDEVLGYLETWSASRRYREAHGTFPTERIRERLTAIWGEETRRVTLWPLTVFVRRKPST